MIVRRVLSGHDGTGKSVFLADRPPPKTKKFLELDDGATRHLLKNDVVVQEGTRQAWGNKAAFPATLVFYMLGRGSRL